MTAGGNLTLGGALTTGGSATFSQPQKIVITSAGDDTFALLRFLEKTQLVVTFQNK